MDWVDLHTHTLASDGTFAPEALVQLAAEIGLRALAVTDHDTVSAVPAAVACGSVKGVEIIPGIELSCRHGDMEIHMLGYYLDCTAPDLCAALRGILDDRTTRNAETVRRLRDAGYPISLEILRENYDTKAIGRTHMADWLVRQGCAQSIDWVFQNLLSEGCPCFVPRRILPMDRAVAIIRSAGGVAVLAHPLSYKMTRAALPNLLAAGRICGVQGVEAVYPGYTETDVREIQVLAAANGMISTGGSDFHGAHRSQVMLGAVRVPYAAVDSLRHLCRRGDKKAPDDF